MKKKIIQLNAILCGTLMILAFQNCGQNMADTSYENRTSQPSVDNTDTQNNTDSQLNKLEFSHLTIGQKCDLGAYRNLPDNRVNMALVDSVELHIYKRYLTALRGDEDLLREFEDIDWNKTEYRNKRIISDKIKELRTATEVTPSCIVKSPYLKKEILDGEIALLDLINQQCDLDDSALSDDVDSELERKIFEAFRDEDLNDGIDQKLAAYKLIVSSEEVEHSGFMGMLFNINKRQNGLAVPEALSSSLAYEKMYGFQAIVNHYTGTSADKCEYDRVMASNY